MAWASSSRARGVVSLIFVLILVPIFVDETMIKTTIETKMRGRRPGGPNGVGIILTHQKLLACP